MKSPQILNAIERGEEHAADQLLPLVHEELRKLAAAKMAHEFERHVLRLADPERKGGRVEMVKHWHRQLRVI